MSLDLDRKGLDLRGTLTSLLDLQAKSDEKNLSHRTFFEPNRIARAHYGENITIRQCNATIKNINYLRAMSLLDCQVTCGYNFTEDMETFTLGYRLSQNNVARAKELLSR